MTWNPQEVDGHFNTKVSLDNDILVVKSVASIYGSQFDGTAINVSGDQLIFYISNNGKRIGSVQISLVEIMALALVAIDKEKSNVDESKGTSTKE